MYHYTPTQWLQTIIKNCLQFLPSANSASHSNTSGSVSELQTAYSDFSQEDKDNISRLISTQFEINDSLLILSYIANTLKIHDYDLIIADQLYAGDFPSDIQTMLEIQLLFLKDIPYDLMRKIHRKSLSCLLTYTQPPATYIPVRKRNTDRILIITEQLLFNINHTPTAMVLEIAYMLQTSFQFEVEIVTCTSNKILPSYLWIFTYGFNSNGKGHMSISYKNTTLSAYQYPLNSCTTSDYQQMLSSIYEFNPLFVLDIGTNSPIADLPHYFTTVVNLNTVTSAPASEADIFVRYTRLNDSLEVLYEKELSPHQTQVFMKQKFPAICNTTGETYTREVLHLPEEQFLICIVGNRLDSEVSSSFKQLMTDILLSDSKIDFVIIGIANELKKSFENHPFFDRIHFLGYCLDLLDIYPVFDLYLNPERVGGGWSSAIALRAGLPVITLPDCDVAYNVTDSFIVPTQEAMRKTILHYASDNSFYQTQKQLAQSYGVQMGENKVNEFLSEMLKKIKDVMPND